MPRLSSSTDKISTHRSLTEAMKMTRLDDYLTIESMRNQLNTNNNYQAESLVHSVMSNFRLTNQHENYRHHEADTQAPTQQVETSKTSEQSKKPAKIIVKKKTKQNKEIETTSQLDTKQPSSSILIKNRTMQISSLYPGAAQQLEFIENLKQNMDKLKSTMEKMNHLMSQEKQDNNTEQNEQTKIQSLYQQRDNELYQIYNTFNTETSKIMQKYEHLIQIIVQEQHNENGQSDSVPIDETQRRIEQASKNSIKIVADMKKLQTQLKSPFDELTLFHNNALLQERQQETPRFLPEQLSVATEGVEEDPMNMAVPVPVPAVAMEVAMEVVEEQQRAAVVEEKTMDTEEYNSKNNFCIKYNAVLEYRLHDGAFDMHGLYEEIKSDDFDTDTMTRIINRYWIMFPYTIYYNLLNSDMSEDEEKEYVSLFNESAELTTAPQQNVIDYEHAEEYQVQIKHEKYKLTLEELDYVHSDSKLLSDIMFKDKQRFLEIFKANFLYEHNTQHLKDSLNNNVGQYDKLPPAIPPLTIQVSTTTTLQNETLLSQLNAIERATTQYKRNHDIEIKDRQAIIKNHSERVKALLNKNDMGSLM